MRLAIADDSALIRDGLRRLLPAHGFEIVAAAANVPALLESIEQTQPDVVLLDIRMPPTYTNEGITAATTIRDQHPGVSVLVLSQYVDIDYAIQLIQAQPTHCGYLLKDRITEIDILLDAIDRVSRGDTVIDPELASLLLRRAGTMSRFAELTNREREVLELLAQGLTDRGISERLWLTPKTVETHIRHILAKLNLPADSTHNRRVLAVLTYLRTGNTETDHTHL
jgi:DNA-binding NarL/FixJ family response regulator